MKSISTLKDATLGSVERALNKERQHMSGSKKGSIRGIFNEVRVL